LDFRPGPMYWGTMDFWTQECPYCGYINKQLDQPSSITREEILKTHEEVESGFDWNRAFGRQLGLSAKRGKTDEETVPSWLESLLAKPAYRRILFPGGQSSVNQSKTDEETEQSVRIVEWESTYAIRFAKLGAMLAKLGKHDEAAMQFLNVAWYFDDEEKDYVATHWRKAAIEQIETMRRRRKETPCSEMLICTYADMLRRSGDFYAVIRLNENELKEAAYIRMIKYQRELSMRLDRAAHKITV